MTGTRHPRRTPLTVMVAVAAVVSSLVVLAGPGDVLAGPTAHHADCSSKKTVKRTVITLLAGNRSHLAYALGYERALANGHVDDNCNYPRAVNNSEYLWVRSRSGRQHNLGPLPKWLDTYRASFVGSTLYAVTSNDEDFEARPIVHWWNVKTHRRGQAEIPEGFYYQSGGPHGFLLTDFHHVFEQAPDGHRTRLPGTGGAVWGNQTGFVTWGDGPHEKANMTYTTYAHPHHHQSLAISAPQLFCPAITRRYVGCDNVADDQSGLKHSLTALIPLSGAKATKWRSGGGGYPMGFANGRLIWSTYQTTLVLTEAGPPPSRGLPRLRNLHYDMTIMGSDPYLAEHQFAVNAVTAYGAVAMINAHHTRVVLVHSLKQTEPLFTVPPRDH